MTGCRVIDLKYVNRMSDGDSAIRKQMLDILVQQLIQELPKIKEAIQKGDCKVLEDKCHSLHSTLMYAGNDTLTKANRNLINMARTNILVKSRALQDFKTITQISRQVVSALQVELHA